MKFITGKRIILTAMSVMILYGTIQVVSLGLDVWAKIAARYAAPLAGF